ncbi:MAG: OstA-like protein [Flavobacteriaceae bacterium]|nr:OstA-like protein [Flavobacteriaceae bacterium]
MRKLLLTLLCCTIGVTVFPQQKRIEIVHADNSNIDEEKYPGATILLGNVYVEHEGVSLRSKKAIHYRKDNILEAFGDVVLNQGDTITQNSAYVQYDGNSKKALSWGNVVLKDPLMTLTTDTLRFDRLKQQLYYRSGASIKDTANVLTSTVGNYYLKTTKFQAQNDVVLTNPDYILKSDHLEYFTSNGKTYLFGPSTITGEDNFIYTENGFYDTKEDISHFTKNSKITYQNREITADSLYYDRNLGFASATKNIKLKDTTNNSMIRGGYAEFYQKLDSAYVVDRAVAIMEIDKDSMYVHGDTLLATGKPENRIIRAYRRVKFFKSNLSGKCDSIHTNQATGLTQLFRNPVLWSNKNQITGDTIHLISNTKTEQLDSLKVLRNTFIVQQDSAGFNQIKGRDLLGKFIDNDLRDVHVIGNGEMIYYARDETSKELIGIDKTTCSSMFFLFKENAIQEARFLTSPEGSTYPLSELPENVRLLRGFIWRVDERPKVKDDIFIKDSAQTPAKKESEEAQDEKPEPPKTSKDKVVKNKSLEKKLNEK